MLTRPMLRNQKREQLRQRAAVLLHPDFVNARLAPLAGNGSRSAPRRWTAEIVRARGTGRTTVRFSFDNGVTLYGKAYTDELGARAYRILRHYWDAGFKPDTTEQVPEPLAFFADVNLLIMAPAQGVPLDRLLGEQPLDEGLAAARAAARWLAALHGSMPPGTDAEPPCERIKMFKLADSVAKAAAAFPEQSRMLLDLLQQLRDLAPAAAFPLVPTHGQYTPANVFLDGERVTTIDMDRVVLSDAAKDVALFAHRVRTHVRRTSGDALKGDRIALEFVTAYRREHELSNPRFAFYAGLFLLKGFAKFAKDRVPGDPLRVTAEAAFRREFARAIGAPTPLGEENVRITS